jgi:apolipoprotein N-acyltransferase
VALFLANPPADLGPLAFVALIPLLWAVGEGRARRGALVGLAFGLVYYGLLLRWLLPFGLIAWLPLVLRETVFAVLFGALAPALSRSRRPVATAVALALAWTALDWARALWPVGGFTWGALAYTQHGDRLLLPLASVTGMWGVTFVVALANGLVLGALARLGKPRQAVALAGVALAAVALPGLVPVPEATGRPIDVAVVQGNVPRELALDRQLQTEAVALNHIGLHQSLAGDPPDLAVWPENSLADDPARNRVLGEAVERSVRAVGAPTVVGAVSPAGDGRLFNQAILYSGSGEIVGRYSKQHLVPGGEYIPFEPVLGWTQRYRRGNAVLAPGTGVKLFRVGGTTVGTPICFENVFPDLFRRFVAEGAELVVLTTNDSSFLESEASREHVIISQIRAVETGRWVVQAAISGESAIIDPAGRVVARTGLFEQRILRAEVPTSSARTLYTRFGDWFAWLAGVIVAGALVAGWVRRRRGSGIDAPPAGERDRAEVPPVPIAGGAEPRTLVILPTYNERPTIEAVLTGVLEAGPRVEALVVDDGSPDGTGEAVAAVARGEPRVRLVSRSGKLGLASAYLTGFRLALDEGYDLVVEMDSDLSHRPEDLPRLLAGAARYDLTIGSRYVPGGAVTNWSRARLAMSKLANAYTRAALRLPVRDATSGYRVYRREALAALMDGGISSEGYAFQVELVHRARALGYSIGEVPITFREREHGKSKLSGAIVVEGMWKVTQWAVGHRFRRPQPQPRR